MTSVGLTSKAGKRVKTVEWKRVLTAYTTASTIWKSQQIEMPEMPMVFSDLRHETCL